MTASSQGPAPDPFGTPDKNRTPFVIGGVVVVAVALVALVAFLVLSDGDDDALDTGDTEQADEDEDPTGDDPAPDSTLLGPDGSEPENPLDDFVDSADAEALEITDKGFVLIPDEFNEGTFDLSYGFRVENPNGDDLVASIVEIDIEFFDDADTAVESRRDVVSVLLPGQAVGSGGSMPDVPGGIVRMEVQAEASQFIRVSGSDGELTVGDVQLAEEEFGGATVSFQVSSTFDERQENVAVYGLFLDSRGEIVGGAQSFLEVVEPGGTASSQIRSFLTIPDLDEAGVTVTLDPTTAFDD